MSLLLIGNVPTFASENQSLMMKLMTVMTMVKKMRIIRTKFLLITMIAMTTDHKYISGKYRKGKGCRKGSLNTVEEKECAKEGESGDEEAKEGAGGKEKEKEEEEEEEDKESGKDTKEGKEGGKDAKEERESGKDAKEEKDSGKIKTTTPTPTTKPTKKTKKH